MAEQDTRGALGLAREQGEAQTLRRIVRELCEALEIGWNDERRSTVEALSLVELRELWRSLLRGRRWP